MTYTAADGGVLHNLGEQHVKFRSREGHRCGHTFQVTDVNSPQISVSALTKGAELWNSGKMEAAPGPRTASVRCRLCAVMGATSWTYGWPLLLGREHKGATQQHAFRCCIQACKTPDA